MEEKDIKDLWKKGDVLDNEKYSHETVERIILSKPKDIVSKFIKTLKIEMWLNLISFAALAIYFIYLQNWLVAIGVSILNALLYFYYHSLIEKLNSESFDIGVVQYLCKVYQSIRRFILHYKILLWLITVPAYFVGIYLSNPDTLLAEGNFLSLKIILILIVGLAVAVTFAHTILYYMYGKKANKIKRMVSLLEKEEIEE